MSIDYQQILMEMNRPQRRQGSALKKLLIAATILILLGSAAFAVWHFNLIDKTVAVANSWLGRDAEAAPEAAATGAATEDGSLAQSAMRPPSGAETSLRPQAAASVPAPNGPINVASAGNSAPSFSSMRPPASSAPAATREDVAAMAAPASSAMPPAPQSSSPSVRPAPAAGMTAAPASAVAAPTAPGRSAASSAAPAPVLSDTRAQLKAIDQMLATQPEEAMRRLDTLMRGRLEPDDAAEAGYRMGYAARVLRDEEKAEQSWKETAEKYPALRGGRFSALALADTWYHKYAGTRSQISYWDDIQLLYSRALGEDDAPFLPENVKAGVKANLNRLNDALFFGTAPTKLGRYHKVESGELLGSIANKYRVDYESIARINGINPNRIRVGMELKLIVGEVSIVVRKNQDSDKTPTLTWFLDGRWMREYPACVGDGIKTPGGTYNLTSKERDPSWTNPLNGQLLPNDHPDNILGSRWMAMRGMNTQGLGIHGTTVDDSVPGYTSAGCVRLLNKDVEELFSFARITNKVTVLE